jgi:mannose-6-phosphate isomerase-like protein (cupin superfamily)
MKKATTLLLAGTLMVIVSFSSYVFGRYQQQGYIVEHEKDIAKEEPGSHQGKGMTTGHHFFAKAPDLALTFKKRVMKPGSSIGYHLQLSDEIFYVVSGTGLMQMNGESFAVKAGDAILTRPGNSHGLMQTGTEDLVVVINYLTKNK